MSADGLTVTGGAGGLEHPGVVDETVGAAAALASGPSTGLLGPLPLAADTAVRLADDDVVLLPRDLAETAGLLARFYEPGRPRVRSAPDDAPRTSLLRGRPTAAPSRPCASGSRAPGCSSPGRGSAPRSP